jgi:hypothetical protein
MSYDKLLHLATLHLNASINKCGRWYSSILEQQNIPANSGIQVDNEESSLRDKATGA